jgi:hypothetical protein
MNRSDIVVAKGRNELLVVYDVSLTGFVTCGVWLGHGVLTSEYPVKELEVVAMPTRSPVRVGRAAWHARMHSLIHVESIEGNRVDGWVLNPDKPGRLNVPLNEVAAMAVSHWLYFWTPISLIEDDTKFIQSRQIHADAIARAYASRSFFYGGALEDTVELAAATPAESLFKVGDRVIDKDGDGHLGTVERVNTDSCHSILVRRDDGTADDFLPDLFRLATWRDEKPLF